MNIVQTTPISCGIRIIYCLSNTKDFMRACKDAVFDTAYGPFRMICWSDNIGIGIGRNIALDIRKMDPDGQVTITGPVPNPVHMGGHEIEHYCWAVSETFISKILLEIKEEKDAKAKAIEEARQKKILQDAAALGKPKAKRASVVPAEKGQTTYEYLRY